MAVGRFAVLSALTGFLVLACGSRSNVDAFFDDDFPISGRGNGGVGGRATGGVAGRPSGGTPSGGTGAVTGGGAFGGSFGGFAGTVTAGTGVGGGTPIAGRGGRGGTGGVAGAGSAGRGGAPGSCCTPHGSPGCSNRAIEACVCAGDGFCCKATWDLSCVDEVEQFACGVCNGTGGAAGAGGSAGAGGASVCDNATDACSACLCNLCPAAVTSCFDDPFCGAILACTERTGCQGLGCYSPGTCQGIIDASGGILSLSMQRLAGIVGCALNTGCPCN